jgi:hypothetical protein
MSAMQDPKIQSIVGMNPQAAQTLQAAMMAHVFEHLGMEYRKQVEQTMGQTLPPYNEDSDEVQMAPDMEIKVSQMAAQASQQLLQQHMQEAEQQKNQQKAQDPLIQLQQQELQIKQGDLQRKAKKDETDAQLKMEQIDVERSRIESQQQTEGARLMAQKVNDQNKINSQQQSEGFRTMAETQRHQQQMEMQRRQQDQKKPNRGD